MAYYQCRLVLSPKDEVSGVKKKSNFSWKQTYRGVVYRELPYVFAVSFAWVVAVYLQRALQFDEDDFIMGDSC